MSDSEQYELRCFAPPQLLNERKKRILLRGRIPTPIIEDCRTSSQLRTEKELKQADSLLEYDRLLNYQEFNQDTERMFGLGRDL